MDENAEKVISSIKVDRRQGKMYSVYVEALPEPLVVHEDIFISYQLTKGRGLTSSLIDEIREENAKYMAYIKGIRYLGTRARSSYQLALHLRRQQFSEPHIAEAIARLKEEGYVDDREYASSYVRSRIGKQGKGRLRVAQELKGQGISSRIIEQTLAKLDEDKEVEAAYEAASKKMRSLHGEPAENSRKLLQFLMRRGYSGAICRKVMQMLEKEDINRLEVDINRELLDN